MNVFDYQDTFRDKMSLQYQLFQILKDCDWHCRNCIAKDIPSGQIAGGGGIQGLQRGTTNRPGLVIQSKTQHCSKCGNTGKWDRWTGEFQASNAASSLPQRLQKRILEEYDYVDVIEERQRPKHELVIDHRYPMERWGANEDKNPIDMSADKIRDKFQLLKKDSSGNHNLLKSRACERCIKTGKRGFPMGIKFYYYGDENWPSDCPTSGPDAERGCYGCGWYDFETWRKELNKHIK